MKHSKGPWIITESPIHDEFVDICAEVGNIASVNTINNFNRGILASEFSSLGVTKEMCEANAYLIAAAPNMYNVLEMIFKENQVDPEVKEMIERVLLQARGEK